jgi:hypothetical protein
MPSANALWRGYVSRNMRSVSRRPRSGTVTNNNQASTRLGGGTNAVASTATARGRSWAKPGGLE